MSEGESSEDKPGSGFLPEGFTRGFGDIFKGASGVAGDKTLFPALTDSAAALARMQESFMETYDLPELYVDTSPRETAEHTARVAEATDTMSALMADLVAATTASLQLSEQARRDNQEAQKTTHRMSVASLWVSIASLAAALGSVVLTVVTIVTGH